MSNSSNIEINDAILIAYINSELSNEQRSQVENWLLVQKNQEHFEEIKKTWNIAKVDSEPVSVDVDSAWNSVFSQIKPEEEENIVPLSNNPNKKLWLRIAAAIVVLVGVFGILKLTEQEEPIQLALKSSDEILKDVLDDGSTVTLNENSILTYPEKFDDSERRVELKGEAFFEISRDEEKPFIVDLPHEMYVKVLGTSFNIKADENDSLTTVYVASGSVEFGYPENHIILEKGDKGILNNRTRELKKERSDNAGIMDLYWIEERLQFNNLELSEVIEILNEIFPEKTELACPEAASLKITSDHRGESLFEILEVLAEVHDLVIVEREVGRSKFKYTLKCND